MYFLRNGYVYYREVQQDETEDQAISRYDTYGYGRWSFADFQSVLEQAPLDYTTLSYEEKVTFGILLRDVRRAYQEDFRDWDGNFPQCPYDLNPPEHYDDFPIMWRARGGDSQAPFHWRYGFQHAKLINRIEIRRRQQQEAEALERARIEKWNKAEYIDEGDALSVRFKQDYNTLEEISLRLNHTVIWYKNEPFFVENIRESLGDFTLHLSTGSQEEGTLKRIRYRKAKDLDCSTPFGGGYLNLLHNNLHQPVWVFRAPVRVFQQGLTSRNMFFIPVVGPKVQRNVQIASLLSGLRHREIITWDEDLRKSDMFQQIGAIRLSDDVVVYGGGRKKQLSVDFRNRYLGTLNNGVVYVDALDMKFPRIEKSLAHVGLERRERT